MIISEPFVILSNNRRNEASYARMPGLDVPVARMSSIRTGRLLNVAHESMAKVLGPFETNVVGFNNARRRRHKSVFLRKSLFCDKVLPFLPGRLFFIPRKNRSSYHARRAKKWRGDDDDDDDDFTERELLKREAATTRAEKARRRRRKCFFWVS